MKRATRYNSGRGRLMQEGAGRISYRAQQCAIAEARRQRVRAQRIALLVTGVGFLLSLLLLFSFSNRVDAASDTIQNYYTYYRAQDVAYGDTLWTYAETYRCKDEGQSAQAYIAEVCEINRLHGDGIKEGQTLILPYYSTEYIE